MKSILLCLAIITANYFIYGQNNIVHIDLTSEKNGIIFVSHDIDALAATDQLFIFPAIVPGMYEQNNFGKYISDFKAIYKNGDTLSPTKKDANAFELENSNDIRTVQYSVKQTTLESLMSSAVFNPGGTNFNDTSYYLLNFHGIVGYFENHQNSSYEIQIKRGKTTGIGALPIRQVNEFDVITASSYDQVADSPFLYANYASQDTVSFVANGMLVQIAVYSDNKVIDAVFLKPIIHEIVSQAASNSLLESYLPEKYCFLFCFEKRNALFQGALEHKTSSVYSYYSDTTGLLNGLAETISHEFFHILTPLNLHSNLITPYYFYNPHFFSKHLWLYEGITEYISFKNNLAAQLIDENEFFLTLNGKMRRSKYYKKNSMITCSQHILKSRSQNYYGNYYEKGALIGFYLDYLISKQTQGKQNISDLLSFLLTTYGKNKPFYENDIIPLITKTFPSTHICFKTCVIGKKNVPFDAILSDLEITFDKSEDSVYYDNWSYGFKGMSYSHKKGFFSAKNSRLNTISGLKKVEIHSVNGIPSNELSFHDFYNGDSTAINIEIQDGKIVKLDAIQHTGYYHPTTTIFPEEGTQQKQLINAILKF